MSKRPTALLEKAAPTLRVILLSAAVLMVAVGWGVPPFVDPTDQPRWEVWRSIAAIPAMVWGLLDAVIAWIKRKQLPKKQEIDNEVYEVLREVESLAVAQGKPIRLSECGLKVWAVGKCSLRDRWKGESRPPLHRVHVSPLYRATSSSGLKWRVGMGVIGTAVQNNDVLAVDVNATWGPIRSVDQSGWSEVPEAIRFGLTFDEFRKLCRNGNQAGPVGPFVLAVPLYRDVTPLGVVALDMPAQAAASIDLGGPWDSGDESVTLLMYALGQRVFEG